MSKIRSRPAFRKERSLIFVLFVLVGFMIITVLVHRFYNSAVVDATIEDELSLKKLGGVELNGTKLRFNSQPQDSLYAEPVIIELTTRNMPDSLFLWQNGKRTTAIKTSDNKFTVEMSKYDDMVTEFIK